MAPSYPTSVSVTLLLILFHLPQAFSNELQLQNYLSRNFSNKARPVLDPNKPVVVTFGFELIQIVDVLETEQIITLKLWLRMSWTSDILRWNPNEYSNIKTVQVNEEDVWTPDLFAVEDIREISSKSKTKVIVNSNGEQIWFHPSVIKASCQFNIESFPFDHQHCVLRYTPWTNDETKLILKMDNRPIISHNYVNSSLFSIRKAESSATSILYDCCPNKYSQLQYTLTIDRKPQYYILHNLVPCAVQMTVILFSFCLPAKYGQRISLLITILLVFAVYLKVLQDSLPKASGSTPALSAFFMVCMAITVLAFIMTCVVITIYSKGTDENMESVPQWVRDIFINYIGKAVLVTSIHGSCYTCVQDVEKQEANGHAQFADSLNGNTLLLLPTNGTTLQTQKRITTSSNGIHSGYQNNNDILNNGSSINGCVCNKRNGCIENKSNQRSSDNIDKHERPIELNIGVELKEMETVSSGLNNSTGIPSVTSSLTKKKDEAENEWFLLARVLDRLFFGLSLIAFIVSWLVLLLPMYVTHN